MRLLKFGVTLAILIIAIAIAVPVTLFVIMPAAWPSISHAAQTMSPATRKSLQLFSIIFAAVWIALLLVPRSKRH